MRKIDGYEINLLERTKKFGVAVIKFASRLPKNSAGFVIADQLIRSGTAICANLIEAQEAVSGKDFLFKITIALREAKETKYWLELIEMSFLLKDEELDGLLHEIEEIVKILVATVRKLKTKV